MKNIATTRQTDREAYEVPAVEVLEIRTEAGFATSEVGHEDFAEEDYQW